MYPTVAKPSVAAALPGKIEAGKAERPCGSGRPDGKETLGHAMRNAGDEELVYRVAEGDERALSELYDRCSRPVYATGIRLLRDVSLAEELVQDVFTNVWRRAGKFDPFTQTTKGNIAQITDAGVITEGKVVKNSEPFGITVAPDGNPWYTMFEANKIATLQLR